MQIEIKRRLCAQSHKNLEAVLKRKVTDREGEKWGGGFKEVTDYFRVPFWADFQKGILIASVGWR